MFKKRKYLLVLFLLVAIPVALALFLMEVVVLVAADRVVISTIPTGYDIRGEDVVAIMKKGESVQVLSCEDGKSSFYYHVRLDSGQEAYISVGDYFLERQAITLSNLDQITFSCIGFRWDHIANNDVCRHMYSINDAGASCKICWYQCPGHGEPVTFPQAVEKECPGITPNGLVDVSRIDPECRQNNYEISK
jgi:hypothetical protein